MNPLKALAACAVCIFAGMFLVHLAVKYDIGQALALSPYFIAGMTFRELLLKIFGK